MSIRNGMELKFLSLSANESFARIAVAAFVSQLNPTMDELTDLKTVVSEAVTNAIIHGYENRSDGWIVLRAEIVGDWVTLHIADEGRGIDNLAQAREPLYTSKPDLERSGMGFTIMENFMDECHVTSEPDKGTTVMLKKRIESKNALFN
jgi:stage II sporulation protein AB (anti-sigma F factor)